MNFQSTVSVYVEYITLDDDEEELEAGGGGAVIVISLSTCWFTGDCGILFFRRRHIGRIFSGKFAVPYADNYRKKNLHAHFSTERMTGMLTTTTMTEPVTVSILFLFVVWFMCGLLIYGNPTIAYCGSSGNQYGILDHLV